MSHWGPSYGEIAGAERRRKEQVPTVEQVVEAALRAIRSAPQRSYSLGSRTDSDSFLSVSPKSHAEELRKTIEADVKSALYGLNAYEYPKD